MNTDNTNEAYFDTIDDNVNHIYAIAGNINHLARAFYATGNETLGNKLSAIVTDLEMCNCSINMAVSKNVKEQWKQAEQRAYNTVESYLAMRNAGE